MEPRRLRPKTVINYKTNGSYKKRKLIQNDSNVSLNDVDDEFESLTPIELSSKSVSTKSLSQQIYLKNLSLTVQRMRIHLRTIFLRFLAVVFWAPFKIIIFAI